MALTKQRTVPRLKRRPVRLVSGKFKDAAFYSPVYCPKATPAENIEWRIRWRTAAMLDRGLQKALRQAAFDDVLFWFNAFCWCSEPRKAEKVWPFCTWPHQDPIILAMDKAISDSEVSQSPIDVLLDKSRGQGATWMYLLIFLRRWLRDPMFSAGLVTRNEKLVDSMQDTDTLLWKLAWEIPRLPKWLLPEGFALAKHRNVTDHTLANPENGASIVGYAATKDVGAGGRKTVFAMDEFARFKLGDDYAALDATQHVTYCRFVVSAHKGDAGAFYQMVQHKEDTNAVRLTMRWEDNPTENAKLYRVVHGKIFEADPRPGNRLGPADLALISEQHKKLKRRGYKIEDKLRNTWYNEECLRLGATPRGIAQELDRDPKGSVAKVFDSETLKVAKAEYARPPLLQGTLIYDSETAKVRAPYVSQSDTGELKLWTRPGLDGEMPFGLYVVGGDVSAGTAGDYTSNSVASVINKMTGEQVAEWTSNSTIPARFGYVLAALGYWFHTAELIVEANFGASCMKILVEELMYPNVYYREVEDVGHKKTTKRAGYWMKDDNAKLGLFETMQEAMAEGKFVARSAALYDECPEYEWRGGRIVHIGSTKSDDEGGKGKAHGDRVIAASLAWRQCDQEPILDTDEEIPMAPPPGSMAERLQEYDREQGQSGDPWLEEGIDIFDRGRVLLGESYY